MFTIGNMIYLFNMSKRLFQGFSNSMRKAIDFRETENLFAVAMKNMKGEAMKFQNVLSEAFGLSMPDLMNAQAIFKNMLSSLGGLKERSSTMLSEVLTKMSIDFASLYNTSIEGALTKMQSGISRQVRPIRSSSGMDITQNVLGASLQQIGIYDRTISQMSEMEKRLLVIYTLQQQMNNAGALGDFSRTIEQPAQQLKILQQQIQETGRWIGAVFEGTLGRVLPYINAFAMAIKEIIKSLAMLTGYEFPDSSAAGNILDQMDATAEDFGASLGSGIDKATEKVKNLLAPFDKVNIIAKPNENNSGGGGGIGGLPTGIDPRILEAIQNYDNGLYKVKMKATEIRDRIMEWLGFTKVVNELTNETSFRLKDGYTNLLKIRDIVAVIGIGFLSWKVSNNIFNLFKAIKKGEYIGGIGKLVKAFNSFKVSGNTIKLMSAFGNSAAYVSTATIFVGIFATVAAIGLRFYDLWQNSEYFRRGVSDLFDILKNIASFVAGAFAQAFKIFDDIAISMGLSGETARGLLVDLAAVGLLFTPAAPFAAAYLIFDAIAWSLKGLGYAFSPVIEQIDVLNGASEQTKENLEPMLETMNDMEIQLKKMDWGNAVPKQKDLSEAKKTLSKFTNDLQKHLEVSKKKAVDTLSAMFKESNFSDKEQQEMLKSVSSTYSEISKEIEKKEKEITAIYDRAGKENRALSDEEVQKIEANQKWLKKQSVTILSESAEEQNKILNNMTVNAKALSLEQASEIIKKSIDTRNQTRAEAEGRYQEQIAIAKKLRQDGGKENEELANKIEEEAKRQKEAAISEAEAMHKAVVDEFAAQKPKISKYLDESTGEIKSKWEVALDDVTENIKTWFDEDVKPWFTKEKWC